ncbi:hypothetical protein RJ640_009720 [Escallonia rubra]|uniref:Acetylajmalan esterase n=1 Tax=Escallonia rubra TaxID=112253 RepID=A0AA88QWA7_9ASTE|nr:hypothetical protein RJ640_009720 [Escallonia rubra]
MAATATRVLFLLALVISSFALSHARLAKFIPPALLGHNGLRRCKFDKIYQFGDSISDTGNLIREGTGGARTPFARPPYGETFFKNATGRCSNGMLMIDYIALAAGLPLLNPYENAGANFRHGVNFAVAGSTALSFQALADKGIASPVTNSSLDIQLDWMSRHLSSICHSNKDCAKKLKHSLFMVGEIGGNDYNYAFLQRKGIEEVKKMVPDVVSAIQNAVRRVIQDGAVHVVVPGNFPIGCLPIYLTTFQSNISAAYDDHHCVNDLNNFAMYHNELLRQAINELKQEHPHATILYGDYYNAFQWLYSHAQYLGFDPATKQKACCGTGGDYDFSIMNMCGDPEVPVCADPRRHISWDGIHLTHEAYRRMAAWLIHNMIPGLKCLY